MKRINLRRLLLFFISGCFAIVVLASTLAESQDRPKKMTPPLAPIRRVDIRTAADAQVFDARKRGFGVLHVWTGAASGAPIAANRPLTSFASRRVI
jgi:hypothetical protein